MVERPTHRRKGEIGPRDLVPREKAHVLALGAGREVEIAEPGAEIGFAGARVTDEEIWKLFMSELKAGNAEGKQNVAGQAVTMLTVMLMDGAFDAGGEQGKKETAS